MVGSIRFMIIGLCLLLGTFALQATAVAAGQGDTVILSIDIEGNRYVEKETVLAKIGSKVGQSLDRRQLSRDVRSLYKSGFFSDIRFVGTRTGRGIKLVCHVKEYPLIAKLRMEGNDEFTLKDLQLRMKLRPGRIFSPMNQVSDSNMLRKGYLKDGFYQVGVEFIATDRKDGRVDVLIRVNEGEVTRVNRIYMIGNKAFSGATLRKEIASRQSSFPTWFSDRDVFEQKRFGADGQMLQQFYMNQGYLDMKVDSKQITMSADKSSFSLTFSIHEGARYKVESVALQGDLVPDQETLEELIELEAGNTYSLNDMRATIEAITERVGDEGYAFASVTPLMSRNINAKTVAVTFDIEKGEEIYIERIEISGNTKSEDNTIRRLIKQSEGARYSGSQIQESKDALGHVAYVKDLRISYPKGSASDKVRMKVDVSEKQTGSFSAGVGFSQQEKVLLTGKLQEENLFGKGYQANLSGEIGKITQNITTSLTNPYFLGSNISASVNAFKTQSDAFTTVSYKTDSVGGGFGFGIPINHHISYGINYSYNSTDLSGVPATASLLLLAQQGRQTIGELVQVLSWDSRDRIMGTSRGHAETLRFGLAGLGGDRNFWEASFSAQSYFPFGENKNIVLNPSFSARMINGYAGKDIPLWRRYSLGGIGSMRGFDANGISLRDQTTNEAIGGDKQVRASVNLFFPFPYMETSGLRGLVFTDAGTVWGTLAGAQSVPRFSLSQVRYTAGFGIEWMSPIGPVGLAWSFPIKTLPGDVERSFEFALGASF